MKLADFFVGIRQLLGVLIPGAATTQAVVLLSGWSLTDLPLAPRGEGYQLAFVALIVYLVGHLQRPIVFNLGCLISGNLPVWMVRCLRPGKFHPLCWRLDEEFFAVAANYAATLPRSGVSYFLSRPVEDPSAATPDATPLEDDSPLTEKLRRFGRRLREGIRRIGQSIRSLTLVRTPMLPVEGRPHDDSTIKASPTNENAIAGLATPRAIQRTRDDFLRLIKYEMLGQDNLVQRIEELEAEANLYASLIAPLMLLSLACLVKSWKAIAALVDVPFVQHVVLFFEWRDETGYGACAIAAIVLALTLPTAKAGGFSDLGRDLLDSTAP